MKKEYEVVMLPAKKSNNIGDIVMRPSDKILGIINVLTKDDTQESINQHLYIISDNEPNVGEWCIDSAGTLFIWENDKLLGKDLCKRVVATTNKSLIPCACKQGYKCDDNNCIPKINDFFIPTYVKAHNEGKPITRVELEIRHDRIESQYLDELKTTEGNYITIYTPKNKKYTRAEVKILLDMQRKICIAKYAHHTNLCEEDIYNIPYPQEFQDEYSIVKIN